MRCIGTVAVCLSLCLTLATIAQEPKAIDPVEESIQRLDAAAKSAGSPADRIRFTRAALALKAETKPVKILEVSKGDTQRDGDLVYDFQSVSQLVNSKLVSIKVKVENTSITETIKREIYNPRLLGCKLTDDAGTKYPAKGDATPARATLGPGETVTYTLHFTGSAGDKATEFYLELPHVNDKPDLLVVLPIKPTVKKSK